MQTSKVERIIVRKVTHLEAKTTLRVASFPKVMHGVLQSFPSEKDRFSYLLPFADPEMPMCAECYACRMNLVIITLRSPWEWRVDSCGVHMMIVQGRSTRLGCSLATTHSTLTSVGKRSGTGKIIPLACSGKCHAG